MKWGIIASVLIVVFFGGMFFLFSRHVPDPPTSATSAANLVKKDLPADLPAMYTPSNPDGEANEVYGRISDFYISRKKDFAKENPPEALVRELADLTIDAMNAGRMVAPFLDDVTPLQMGAEPEYGDMLQSTPSFVLQKAMKDYENGDKEYAIKQAQAIFAFGQRCFQHSSRLYVRNEGMFMMRSAVQQLAVFNASNEEAPDPDLDDRLKAWNSALDKINKPWDAKLRIVMSLSPHVGDILNIAKNDQDVSFRAQAALDLGICKFAAGHKGNEIAIQETIAALKDDPALAVSQAAKAADALTRDQMRKLR